MAMIRSRSTLANSISSAFAFLVLDGFDCLNFSVIMVTKIYHEIMTKVANQNIFDQGDIIRHFYHRELQCSLAPVISPWGTFVFEDCRTTGTWELSFRKLFYKQGMHVSNDIK